MPKGNYAKPPIDEATCQFTLANDFSWDNDTPSHLFEHIKSYYPALPQQQQLLQANLTVSKATSAIPDISLANTSRIVFMDDNAANRLSVSPNSVAVHRIRPYSSFEKGMLERITRDLPKVLQAFDHEDSFKAISTRYVNRIAIPRSSIELAEYFSHWGAENSLPEPFNKQTTGFLYRTSAQHSELSENLTVTFGSLDAPKDTTAFILDLDLTHRFDEPVPTATAIERTISIHTLIRSTFEALITDKCRELFE